MGDDFSQKYDLWMAQSAESRGTGYRAHVVSCQPWSCAWLNVTLFQTRRVHEVHVFNVYT